MQDENGEELQEMSLEELQDLKICMNCNYYVPSPDDEPTEFGICLFDGSFDPYVEEILEEGDFSSCQDLVDEKEFNGNRDICEEFVPAEFIAIDLDIDREEIESLSKEDLREYFSQALLEKCFVPVEELSRRLDHPQRDKRKEAVKALKGLWMFHHNKEALEALKTYLKELPVVETIEDVHHKIEVLKDMERDDGELLAFLVEELYKTPSNNTTRQWISAIFDFLSDSSLPEAEEALEKIGEDTKNFSHRLRKKAKGIIDYKTRWGF